jgi:hypothetical protein
MVLSSSLKHNTFFSFIFTAAATLLESEGLAFNLGDCQGDSCPKVEAGRQSTPGSPVVIGDDEDDGEGVILGNFLFLDSSWPSWMISVWHVCLQ